MVVLGMLLLPVLADAEPAGAAPVVTHGNLFLDQLTSTEVRDLLAAGSRTVLIPIGATEQTGPFVALGKHNERVQYLAGRIAAQLGNTLVAPVVSYVPEGAINPPAAHMKFAGTISIPDAAFIAMLEGAARSLRQHGFRTIVLIGDHGGYRQDLDQVASHLNREWGAEPGNAGKHSARVIHLTEYYRLSSSGFNALLKQRGFSEAEIGAHGGLSDTALTMATSPELVRSPALRASSGALPGVVGDPRRATAELGQAGVQLIVDGSVKALQAAIGDNDGATK